MAIKEKATNQKASLQMNSNIVSETTTYSGILDTANYDLGVYFLYVLSANDSTAVNATFSIQEGDAANMSDAADVAAAKLVYGSAVTLTAANSVGSGVYKEAVFSTKRYLRIKVVTTGHGVDIQALVFAIVNPELGPTAQV